MRDAAGHRYTFPDGFRLGAGKQGVNGQCSHRQGHQLHDVRQHAPVLGRGWYVWNNTGDKVILRRADGSLKDTCTYPGEGASKYYC